MTGTAPLLLTDGNKEFLGVFRQLQQASKSLAPPRSALSLSLARPFANHLAVIELKEPMMALVRLVGTAIVERTGTDNTGQNWLEVFAPQVRTEVWRRLRRLCDTPLGVRALIRERHTFPILVETLNLPFSDDAGSSCFMISTAFPVDIDKALLRGEYLTQDGGFIEEHLIDLGAGIGEAR